MAFSRKKTFEIFNRIHSDELKNGRTSRDTNGVLHWDNDHHGEWFEFYKDVPYADSDGLGFVHHFWCYRGYQKGISYDLQPSIDFIAEILSVYDSKLTDVEKDYLKKLMRKVTE